MYVQVADLVKDVNHTGCCENETWCSLYVWTVRDSAPFVFLKSMYLHLKLDGTNKPAYTQG